MIAKLTVKYSVFSPLSLSRNGDASTSSHASFTISSSPAAQEPPFFAFIATAYSPFGRHISLSNAASENL